MPESNWKVMHTDEDQILQLLETSSLKNGPGSAMILQKHLYTVLHEHSGMNSLSQMV